MKSLSVRFSSPPVQRLGSLTASISPGGCGGRRDPHYRIPPPCAWFRPIMKGHEVSIRPVQLAARKKTKLRNVSMLRLPFCGRCASGARFRFQTTLLGAASGMETPPLRSPWRPSPAIPPARGHGRVGGGRGRHRFAHRRPGHSGGRMRVEENLLLPPPRVSAVARPPATRPPEACRCRQRHGRPAPPDPNPTRPPKFQRKNPIKNNP